MYSSSSSVLFLVSLLASSTCYAQITSTMTPVSQIPDGQPQAPASTPLSSVSAATPTSVYVNPFITETDSLGVVTGQPTAETSQPLPITTQPSVITSQAPAATFESTAPGIPVGLNTTLIPVVSSSASAAGTSAAGNLSTSSRTSTASRTVESSESTESATSTDFSNAPASSSSAAAAHVAAGTGFALGLAGSVFAMLL